MFIVVYSAALVGYVRKLLTLLREGVKKLDYLVTSIKRVGRYLAEITISLSLRNSDISLGRWVSEEDVTVSK